MNLPAVCTGALAICLLPVPSVGADAPSKPAARDIVRVSGCATMGPPVTLFCLVVPARGISYVVKSARPPIPLGLGVTVVGRRTGEVDAWCDGVDLEVISWRSNSRVTCPR